MYKIDRMRKEYEQFTAAQGYIVGFPIGDKVYGAKLDKIPRRFIRIQKEYNGGYGLYVSITNRKQKAQLLKKAEYICSLNDIMNGEYNKGVMFEKKVYEHYGQEFRGKDNIPFYVSGDITIDGKEIQIKYLHARMCYEKTLQKLKNTLDKQSRV